MTGSAVNPPISTQSLGIASKDSRTAGTARVEEQSDGMGRPSCEQPQSSARSKKKRWNGAQEELGLVG
jgi:hypothetical protein